MSLAKHSWVFNKKFGSKLVSKTQDKRYSVERRRFRARSISSIQTGSSFGSRRDDAANESRAAPEYNEFVSKTNLPTRKLADMKFDMEVLIHQSDFALDSCENSGLKECFKYFLELGESWEYQLEQGELDDSKRVPGCAARVWLEAKLEAKTGTLRFYGYSDSAITKGMCALLCSGLSGLSPEQFLEIDEAFIKELGLGPILTGSTHQYGLFSIFESMKKAVYSILGHQTEFPSLCVTADNLIPKGSYAESQAEYLEPDQSIVKSFLQVAQEEKIGIVAHFYMDPQVQGILADAKSNWKHIHISDSLVMADKAVEMAEAGCKTICVLGVDFMSENVRATLDYAGYEDVKVYRMASDPIGCTLAEAAHSSEYDLYLKQAATYENSLHVVYINTSLQTKATAQAMLPTITCTSSNVLYTILQAAAQVPDVNIFYGPDSYMGANLEEVLNQMVLFSDEEIKKVHPDHNRASIRSLINRFHYFKDGICIVHHMFGSDVASAVQASYTDAYLTAHFEVPGEMFRLALEASTNGDRGVIGSTKNILDFIIKKVEESISYGIDDKLKFVLGTESGMITSIVNGVQDTLRQYQSEDVSVEIVFPVSSQAIVNPAQQNAPALPEGLSVLPGAASGEGCGTDGGCASCPYMKMNSLDALLYVMQKVKSDPESPILDEFAPKMRGSHNGQSYAEIGSIPILNMRHMQQHKMLSEELVQDIKNRNADTYSFSLRKHQN